MLDRLALTDRIIKAVREVEREDLLKWAIRELIMFHVKEVLDLRKNIHETSITPTDKHERLSNLATQTGVPLQSLL